MVTPRNTWNSKTLLQDPVLPTLSAQALLQAQVHIVSQTKLYTRAGRGEVGFPDIFHGYSAVRNASDGCQRQRSPQSTMMDIGMR
jgi:hypothetical protein